MRKLRDPEDLEGRVADLLQRRRAGLLREEKLHLAAYLGDPAARVLWSQEMPDEAEMRAGPLARFFEGVEETVDRSWGRLKARAQPRTFAAAVEWASREPRLRRLFAGRSTRGQLVLDSCDRARGPFELALSGPEQEGISLQRSLDFGGYKVIPGQDPEAAVRELVASLPAEPRPVWHGRRKDLPLARVRLGLLNDALGWDGKLAGLFAWPRPVHIRAVLASRDRMVAIWNDSAPGHAQLRACLDAIWIQSPSSEATRDLNVAARALKDLVLLAETNLESSASAIAQLAWFAPRLSDHRQLDQLRFFISAEEIFTAAARELIPWALYDEEPRAR